MKAGDIVRYSRVLEEGEEELRFVLMAPPEKGRVDIQLICDWTFKPIETVAESEVKLADEALAKG
ncbi:MAG: hypothetical protein WCO56_27435 [Verrucomicrobiota bacterium]